MCCQVAYPKIYDLIFFNPDIENSWDENLAFEITQKNEEKDEKFVSFFEDLKKQEYDDDWEQCLYRICYADKQLQKKFFTSLVNFLKLANENEKKIEANLEDFNLICLAVFCNAQIWTVFTAYNHCTGVLTTQ